MTRLAEANCVALCVGCHALWEGDKQGEYTDFMKDRLGIDLFEELKQAYEKEVRDGTYKWDKEELQKKYLTYRQKVKHLL